MPPDLFNQMSPVTEFDPYDVAISIESPPLCKCLPTARQVGKMDGNQTGMLIEPVSDRVSEEKMNLLSREAVFHRQRCRSVPKFIPFIIISGWSYAPNIIATFPQMAYDLGMCVNFSTKGSRLQPVHAGLHRPDRLYRWDKLPASKLASHDNQYISSAVGNVRPVIPINLIRRNSTGPAFRANQ